MPYVPRAREGKLEGQWNYTGHLCVCVWGGSAVSMDIVFLLLLSHGWMTDGGMLTRFFSFKSMEGALSITGY